LQQGIDNRAHRRLDQCRLVVIGLDLDALGQVLVDRGKFLLDGGDDLGGIAADQFQHHPYNHFSFAVLGGESAPDFATYAQFTQLVQINGRAVDGFHYDIAQCLKVRGQTDGAHDVLFIILDDELCPGVGIVGLYALLDVGQ